MTELNPFGLDDLIATVEEACNDTFRKDWLLLRLRYARSRAPVPTTGENPYRKLDDEFDHAAEALTWDEGYAAGFAAGRAAACDERDKAVEAVSVAAIHHVEAMREMRGKVDELRADRDRMKQAFRDFRADAEAIPTASPDERLREADRAALVESIAQTERFRGGPCLCSDCVEKRADAEATVDAVLAALAAADRDKEEDER